MNRARVFGAALGVVLLMLGVAMFDLYGLQAGLETAGSEERAKATKLAAEATVNPKKISRYPKFMVQNEDGLELTVYARENPEASINIVMFHGAASGAWAWEYYFELFPENFNLYAPSWRGHFDSEKVADANSLDYVNDQLAVVQNIQQRNDLSVHAIAHSYGAATTVFLEAWRGPMFGSLHLIAPVVPLDYTPLQAIVVPVIARHFIAPSIAEGNKMDGTFGGMFISHERMTYYHTNYAGKHYSIEKPSLIVRDGVKPVWQDTLMQAYMYLQGHNIPVSFYLARYDNVVVPKRQRQVAEAIGASMHQFESGHYIQLDAYAEKSAALILQNIKRLEQLGLEHAELKSFNQQHRYRQLARTR